MNSAFVNGTRVSGVCAFIAGYFEYEHKNVVNTSASNTDFSHLPMRYHVHNNYTAHTMTKCYANTIPDINIMIYTCVHD